MTKRLKFFFMLNHTKSINNFYIVHTAIKNGISNNNKTIKNKYFLRVSVIFEHLVHVYKKNCRNIETIITRGPKSRVVSTRVMTVLHSLQWILI